MTQNEFEKTLDNACATLTNEAKSSPFQTSERSQRGQANYNTKLTQLITRRLVLLPTSRRFPLTHTPSAVTSQPCASPTVAALCPSCTPATRATMRNASIQTRYTQQAGTLCKFRLLLPPSNVSPLSLTLLTLAAWLSRFDLDTCA